MDPASETAKQGSTGEASEMTPEVAPVQTWWQNAIPEAIGGATVALIVFVAEWIRGGIVRSRQIGKARFAALTELRTIRSSANSVLEAEAMPAEVHPLRTSALQSLVQIGMEGLGKPDHEAALAVICEEVDTFNALTLRLVIETSGISRAMGDHSQTVSGLWTSLQQAARRIVENVDGLARLLRR